jgi:putative inorganic carbon (hco3(-)) transporter
MLDKVFSIGLDLFAFVLPISIAATNIVFFPLAALWLFGARWTFSRWPPFWGWPEKIFGVFFVVSLLSAVLGINPAHSLLVIKNKDFYLLIAIVLVALVRARAQNERLLKLFMAAGVVTAVWGLVQYTIGVNMVDKGDPYFFYLPKSMAHWPRPVINLFGMINGRVLGTRGHPLAYAECLLFNWALAICFLLGGRGREWIKWMIYLVLVGAALLVSQSRGPWIAAVLIALLAVITSASRRGWLVAGLGAGFAVLFVVVPSMRERAVSILDRSNNSNKERVHMWHAGAQIWKTHPLLGIGPGSVKEISVNYQTPEEKVFGSWGHLHSTYVNFLVERGLAGLLIFGVFMGALWRELWQALRRSSGDPWREAVLKGSLLGIVGFLTSGLTETTYNTAVVMMTFYFVVGLALALTRHPGVACD